MRGARLDGFCDLETVCEHQNDFVTVIGVVTDVMPPRPSAGKDHMITFTIDDGSLGNKLGQKCRWFSQPSNLPPINNVGDVMILRLVKVMQNRGLNLLVSANNRSTWIVFAADNIPKNMPSFRASLTHTRSRGAGMPSISEMQRVIELRWGADESKFQAPPSPDARLRQIDPRQKFALIKDLAANNFYDLTVEVVKIFRNLTCTELYVTDYTTNSLLYQYEARDDHDINEKSQWSGPLGRQTIQISLFQPHDDYACHHLQQGSLVNVTNLRTRYGNKGCSWLDGVLHTDRRDEDRVDLRPCNPKSDRASHLLARKDQYLKDHPVKDHPAKAHSVEQAREEKPIKRSYSEAADLESNEAISDKHQSCESAQISRSKRRRQNRRKRELGNAKSVEADANRDELASCEAQMRMSKKTLNPNIRVEQPKHPARLVHDILSTVTHAFASEKHGSCTLPYQNITSQAVVRIVDYKPSELADFAVQRQVRHRKDHSENIDEDTPDDLDPDSEATNAWEWRFALLLEEADKVASGAKNAQPSRIAVYVTQGDAEHLLNLKATDLRNDATALAKLKEKLFLLWGDLSERKQQQRKNAPVAAETTRPALAECSNNIGARHDLLEKRNHASATTSMWDEPVQSPPFSCWLQEYGRKVDGDAKQWQRLWRMTMTKIV